MPHGPHRRAPFLLALLILLVSLLPQPSQAQEDGARAWIRVNLLGYLPERPKVAVLCALDARPAGAFSVEDAAGRTVLGGRMTDGGAFGPCTTAHRLDFGAVRAAGTYTLVADGLRSPPVRIGAEVYAGAADSLLAYMRQQRSGFNPLFRDSVHHRTDGILVDHAEAGRFIDVSGGWADAADYLQYVTTSATATWQMLMAYRDHPAAFGDRHAADGLPGANGTPDVLDEARHGLEWLLKMYPRDDLLLNQLGDDRDHSFPDLPTNDSSDYGWGKGGPRPVYPCTGRPQGLLRYRNRSEGMASTAGKMASAFALGARLFAERDPAFAATLARKAEAAYALGQAHPGVCQTAPARAAYFYEEQNWTDDMELAAAALGALTGRPEYGADALRYARMEPVTPWMGADTALHYQWYPWHNNGHHEAWRLADEAGRRELAGFYRDGLSRVAARAGNGFRVGIPFIWCSNDLMTSFATQAMLYRRMTGDARFEEMELAALDWLLGANPWGVSMVIGFPADGRSPRDPHSIIAQQMGVATQMGGLVDGPVYRSIFQNLAYVRLYEADEFEALNTGSIVYHDDFGDYSTNEPIMDGTANLAYLLSALAPPRE
jgi:endoglucanase